MRALDNVAFTCPDCGSAKIDTIDSRSAAHGCRKRRYRCHGCGRRFTTVEVPIVAAETQGRPLVPIFLDAVFSRFDPEDIAAALARMMKSEAETVTKVDAATERKATKTKKQPKPEDRGLPEPSAFPPMPAVAAPAPPSNRRRPSFVIPPRNQVAATAADPDATERRRRIEEIAEAKRLRRDLADWE